MTVKPEDSDKGIVGGSLAVDKNESAIADALDKHGKVYRKVAQVHARRATQETAVKTVLADGTWETNNIAEPGDYVVTGAGGERYVVKSETFKVRYAPKRGRKAVYLARGQIVAFKNPFGRPICLKAPWGEMQYGSEDCMIADALDPATQQLAGEPYLIAGEEFTRTYKPVQAAIEKNDKNTK